MKSLQNIIIEKLKINKDSQLKKLYNYQPTTRNELSSILLDLIDERGYKADLNDIDVSKITDFSFLFYSHDLEQFDGDISKWNVSNVSTFEAMFYNTKFSGINSDLSNWDMSNADCISCMFERSQFNQKEQIEHWNINEDVDMQGIFHACPLEKNPPKWYKK